MKIQLTNKSKINNPIEFVLHDDPSYINSFQGEFNNFIFEDENSEFHSYLKPQINNLNYLKNLLSTLNLELEYIWLIIFRNDSNRATTSFVLKTNTNQNGLSIYWRKYMSKSEGSGQNDVFLVKNEEFVQEGCVDKIKVQLTQFLKEPNTFLTSI